MVDTNPANVSGESQDEPHKAEAIPKDLLLIIFIHGFKGTDSTFGHFPERLRHILTETVANAIVESVIFPVYETKGELNAAVIRFADWLTDLTVQREVANGVGGGAGKAKIILCGHSMGGLLAADALIEFARTRPDPTAPLWPNIIACLAFDTPYFGIHPHIFKNTATQAAGYVQSAHSLFTNFTSRKSPTPMPATPKAPPAAAIAAPPAQPSIWSKWAPAAYAVGGALIAGAAAGTAYYKRQEISVGYTWAADHMKYVGTLWDEPALRKRVDTLLEIEEQMGVTFRVFYTWLPPNLPAFPSSRTFIVLPRVVTTSSKFGSHFLQAPNGLASDEIQAHTGMFDGKTNDGYYELGLLTSQLIRDAIISIRTNASEDEAIIPTSPPASITSFKEVDKEPAEETTGHSSQGPVEVEAAS
ncbi:hypothetical protein NLI96_g10159 [Meripilus lineatus]|uniref:DUF676 domain-containing protein n=1 Tax=Meripilus lineatus TaxID=2056292 RepID=A0AAD5UZC9_9APHY|nr:hypothetical protein NLI96_g10159 [Physisporinus lineatus]